jgi:hypothetical protein
MEIQEIQPYVGLLTIEQKELLVSKLYDDDSYFNPIMDSNEQWVISVEEITLCTNPEFKWVTELPLIEYTPKPDDDWTEL